MLVVTSHWSGYWESHNQSVWLGSGSEPLPGVQTAAILLERWGGVGQGIDSKFSGLF